MVTSYWDKEKDALPSPSDFRLMSALVKQDTELE